MNRDHLLNSVVVALSLCAITTTALLVRRELFAPSEGRAAVVRLSDWRDYSQGGQRMGPENAPVRIVVFSDFQCPYCRALMDTLRTLRQAYPTEVSVRYRHAPVPSHPHAYPAARTSECAAAQGRFEEYHDALFAAQDSIGILAWEDFATRAGIRDLKRFRACADGAAPMASITRDTLAARKLRVTGTPTLLINDVRVEGALTLDALRAYVKEAHGAEPRASS